MPRTIDPMRYPGEFFRYADAVQAGTQIELPFPKRGMALHMQQQWRAFVRAITKSAERSRDREAKTIEERECERIWPLVCKIEAVVDGQPRRKGESARLDEPGSIIFRHVSDNPYAIAMRKGLAQIAGNQEQKEANNKEYLQDYGIDIDAMTMRLAALSSPAKPEGTLPIDDNQETGK